MDPVEEEDAAEPGDDAGLAVDVLDASVPEWEPPTCEAPTPNATILGNTPVGPMELAYVHVGSVFGGTHDCIDIHLAFSTTPVLEVHWDEHPMWGPGDVMELTMYAGEAELIIGEALPVHAMLHHGKERLTSEGTVIFDSFGDDTTAASGNISIVGAGWSVTGSFSGNADCILLADNCI